MIFILIKWCANVILLCTAWILNCVCWRFVKDTADQYKRTSHLIKQFNFLDKVLYFGYVLYICLATGFFNTFTMWFIFQSTRF